MYSTPFLSCHQTTHLHIYFVSKWEAHILRCHLTLHVQKLPKCSHIFKSQNGRDIYHCNNLPWEPLLLRNWINLSLHNMRYIHHQQPSNFARSRCQCRRLDLWEGPTMTFPPTTLSPFRWCNKFSNQYHQPSKIHQKISVLSRRGRPRRTVIQWWNPLSAA